MALIDRGQWNWSLIDQGGLREPKHAANVPAFIRPLTRS